MQIFKKIFKRSSEVVLKSHLPLVLGIMILCMVAISLVLVFLLALVADNRDLYERYYPWLLRLNMAVAAALFIVLVWGVGSLAQRLRLQRFGSKLLFKLAVLFCVVGIIPGVLIYTVSYQFVSRSIESWFDVKVEGALNAGVKLARTSLETLEINVTARTRYAGSQLAAVSDHALSLAVEKTKQQLDASNVVVWDANGRVLANAGTSRFEFAPARPPAQAFQTALWQHEWSQFEGLEQAEADGGESTVRVQSLVPIIEAGWEIASAGQRFLQVTSIVPKALVTQALLAQNSNREYQERAYGRKGLRSLYIGTLTLSLFLAVLGAIVLALVLGNRLLRPILILAEGVREVSEGNLNPKTALSSTDELGGLTRAFAMMTHQLAAAQKAERISLERLEISRAQLQTILDNLTAGVVVLNSTGNIVSANPGASRILRTPLETYLGRPLLDIPVLVDFAESIWQQFEVFLSAHSRHNSGHWQQTYELHVQANALKESLSNSNTNSLTIVIRGALLTNGNRLLVFDDISQVVSAQRMQAWGEVARRLAHEIKNPLTPIQLSAERLELRLSGKLAEREQKILNKSVSTIVEQVAAMLRLVNEFREYARLPAAQLEPIQLNELIADIMHMYESDASSFPIQTVLENNCPPIMGDITQLRQVIHNLVQNAQDASLQIKQEGQRKPKPILLSTEWNISQQRVVLSVQDNGSGFSPRVLQRIFEPYVTTKVRGTGLGLAVVKKIADDHGAKIDFENCYDENKLAIGARISLSFAIVLVTKSENAQSKTLDNAD